MSLVMYPINPHINRIQAAKNDPTMISKFIIKQILTKQNNDVNPTINVPSGDGVGNQCNYDDVVDGLLIIGFTTFMISTNTNPHGP